jgi:hypothetical protein
MNLLEYVGELFNLASSIVLIKGLGQWSSASNFLPIDAVSKLKF